MVYRQGGGEQPGQGHRLPLREPEGQRGHHSHRTPRRRGERGQAIVEFGLLSIIMITMLAGAIDFGRLFYTQIALANAARVGAEWLIEPANFSDLSTAK